MDWDRHRRRIYAHLGVDVVWTPVSTGIAAAPVRVYFQSAYQRADFLDGGIHSRNPVVDLVDADFIGLARGDKLTIGSSDYIVKERPQPDGLGGMLVHLKGPIESGTGVLQLDDGGLLELDDGGNLEVDAA